MNLRIAALLLLGLLVGGHAGLAQSRMKSGKHCIGAPGQSLYLTQALVGQLEPSGVLHILQFSYCRPLITHPGLLFDYTHLELGAMNYLAPTFSHYGVFIGISPLSFFKVRAEVSFFHQWTIPIDGKGYFPLSGYQADFSDETLKSSLGKSASGVNAKLTLTLQARVKLGGMVELLLKNDIAADYWWLDRRGFYKNQRLDLVLQRSDVALTNTAVVLLNLRFHRNMAIAFGAADVLSYVPANPYTANLVAGMVVFTIKRLGSTVRDLSIFTRLGAYTHHANRKGKFTGVIGAAVHYDLKRF